MLRSWGRTGQWAVVWICTKSSGNKSWRWFNHIMASSSANWQTILKNKLAIIISDNGKGVYVDRWCSLRKQKWDKPRRFYNVKSLQCIYGVCGL
jgi:hypothetical protein